MESARIGIRATNPGFEDTRRFMAECPAVGCLMAAVIDRRMTAEIEGEFVVFLIGMRINKPWKVHKWLPVFLAMPRMLRELRAHPEAGMLWAGGFGLTIVQYWRSFEHLEAYARSKDMEHWPAWVAFNRRTGRSRGDVGIWHETYRLMPGQYEAVYSGMPPIGLGAASRLVPVASGTEAARDRMMQAKAMGAQGSSEAPTGD